MNPNNTPEKDKDSSFAPDPETLHTTDPQEHMKGPVSSTMNGIADDAEKRDKDEPVPEGGSEQNPAKTDQ
jgi:hypothetical protein